jgi:hypothetical protein
MYNFSCQQVTIGEQGSVSVVLGDIEQKYVLQNISIEIIPQDGLTLTISNLYMEECTAAPSK